MRKFAIGQEIELFSFITNEWHDSIILDYSDKLGIRIPDGSYLEGDVYVVDTSFKGDPDTMEGHSIEPFIRPRKKPLPPVVDFNEMIKDLKETKPKEVVNNED